MTRLLVKILNDDDGKFEYFDISSLFCFPKVSYSLFSGNEDIMSPFWLLFASKMQAISYKILPLTLISISDLGGTRIFQKSELLRSFDLNNFLFITE